MSTKTIKRQMERNFVKKMSSKIRKSGRNNQSFDTSELLGEFVHLVRDIAAAHGPGSKSCDKEDRAALQQAQKLMDDARKESSVENRISLAKAALETSAYCAEAYILLAEDQAQNLEEAEKLYREAVAVGGQAMHLEVRTNPNALGWDDEILLAQLRAMKGLAHVLYARQNYGEAIDTCFKILLIDDSDELHVIRLLIPTLIKLNKLEEAEACLKGFRHDTSAHLVYSRALLLFKKHGESDIANKALWKAIRQNSHVINLVRGIHKLTKNQCETYRPGSLEEAQDYLTVAIDDWTKQEEIINWVMNLEREQVQKLTVIRAFPGLTLVN
jgi:tetratricopeptide (TPR) repeat protein